MEKIKKTIASISGLDQAIIKKTQSRLDSLTKPMGSLGRLEELAKQICGIAAKESPLLRNKVIFTLASDHGVTEEGVSPYPKEV
ncbi:MAG: nicotinate-nucleotide--dimethylbenzimidazole phosphoribosyltransferase, partial [bacterium]